MQQHTSAEVAAMTPEQAMKVRQGTAAYQRSVPERTMNDIQFHTGGGVWSTAVEHVGDLSHRMNQAHSTDITMGDVMPKVHSQLSNLSSRYGFAKEHGENLRSNAAYHGVSEGDHIMQAEHLGKKYAEEHRRTPVYNYPTEVAVDAAVSLGEGRFNDTRGHLEHLSAMQMGGKAPSGEQYAPGDMEGLLEGNSRRPTALHQQGMVDYLRGRESRTPAITEAATVMLGGKK
jgi:hypothetical protein